MPRLRHTCRTSSKWWATWYFISATLFGNWRIESIPKGGVSEKLWSQLSNVRLGRWKDRPYRLLSIQIFLGSIKYSIWIRCLRTNFKTPSSNSCKRLTTKMGKKLNPSGESLSTKVFCIACKVNWRPINDKGWNSPRWARAITPWVTPQQRRLWLAARACRSHPVPPQFYSLSIHKDSWPSQLCQQANPSDQIEKPERNIVDMDIVLCPW